MVYIILNSDNSIYTVSEKDDTKLLEGQTKKTIESSLDDFIKSLPEVPHLCKLDNDSWVVAKDKQETEQKNIRKKEIIHEIDNIDFKRIRAIAEGGEQSPGISWLDYYTDQIVELRKELSNLF